MIKKKKHLGKRKIGSRKKPERMRHKKKSKKSPCILIVDDDVDSIMPVAFLFRQLGCNIICVTDFDEAVKSISSQEADIIILDWCLGEKNGGEIIKNSVKNLNETSVSDEKISYLNSLEPKIITYSSLDKDQISLIKNKIFNHIDHWQKPLKCSELLMKMEKLV